jgi:hypothetical protein
MPMHLSFSFPKIGQTLGGAGAVACAERVARLARIQHDRNSVPEGRAVAVGTRIAPRPPHRPVRALLTHTVLTSDMGMFGVKTRIRIRLTDLDRWKQRIEPLAKMLPGETVALAPSP